ncbi:hypothetical protein RCL1_000906 [Eukaryota sp. TZLM3-RCL]
MQDLIQTYGSTDFDLSSTLSEILLDISPSLSISDINDHCVSLADQEFKLRKQLLSKINSSSSTFIGGISHMSSVGLDLSACKQILRSVRQNITKARESFTTPALDIIILQENIEIQRNSIKVLEYFQSIYTTLSELIECFSDSFPEFGVFKLNFNQKNDWLIIFERFQSFSISLSFLNDYSVKLKPADSLLSHYDLFAQYFTQNFSKSLFKLNDHFTRNYASNFWPNISNYFFNLEMSVLFNQFFPSNFVFSNDYFKNFSNILNILLRKVVSKSSKSSLSNSEDLGNLLTGVDPKFNAQILVDSVNNITEYLKFLVLISALFLPSQSKFLIFELLNKNFNQNLFDCSFDYQSIYNHDTLITSSDLESIGGSNIPVIINHVIKMIGTLFESLLIGSKPWSELFKVFERINDLQSFISETINLGISILSPFNSLQIVLNNISQNLILTRIFGYTSEIFTRSKELLTVDQFMMDSINQNLIDSPKIKLLMDSSENIENSFKIVGYSGKAIIFNPIDTVNQIDDVINDSVWNFPDSPNPIVTLILTDLFTEIIIYSNIFPNFSQYFGVLVEFLFLYFVYHVYVFFGMSFSPPIGSNLEFTMSPSIVALLSHIRLYFDPDTITTQSKRSKDDFSKNINPTRIFDIISSFKSNYKVDIMNFPFSLSQKINGILSIKNLFTVLSQLQSKMIVKIPTFFRLSEPLSELINFSIRSLSFNLIDYSLIPNSLNRIKWDDMLPLEVSSIFVENVVDFWSRAQVIVENNQLSREFWPLFLTGFVDNLTLSILEGFLKVKKFGNSGLARLSMDIQVLKKEFKKILKSNFPSSWSELEQFSKLLWLADYSEFFNYLSLFEFQPNVAVAAFKSGLVSNSNKKSQRKSSDIVTEIREFIGSKRQANLIKWVEIVKSS